MASNNSRDSKTGDFVVHIDVQDTDTETTFNEIEVLSDLTPEIARKSDQVRSCEENEDGTPSEGEISTVPTQINVLNVEKTPKSNWILTFFSTFNLFTFGGILNLFTFWDTKKEQNEPKPIVYDEEDQLEQWRNLLNSIGNEKEEQNVKRKIDEFISSTNMTRLK